MAIGGPLLQIVLNSNLLKIFTSFFRKLLIIDLVISLVTITLIIFYVMKKIEKIQGVLTFRDFTIRDPRKFVIYFQGLNS